MEKIISRISKGIFKFINMKSWESSLIVSKKNMKGLMRFDGRDYKLCRDEKEVSISNKLTKLERKKKMPIKIFTEKCIIDGKRSRGIVSVEGVLSRSALPKEYLIGRLPAFYYNSVYGSGGHTDNKIRRYILLKCEGGEPLLEAKAYPENEFQQILSYIRKAGENLQKINQKLKLEQWKGKEEFII